MLTMHELLSLHVPPSRWYCRSGVHVLHGTAHMIERCVRDHG